MYVLYISIVPPFTFPFLILFFLYCMSKKKLPILYSKLLYKNGSLLLGDIVPDEGLKQWQNVPIKNNKVTGICIFLKVILNDIHSFFPFTWFLIKPCAWMKKISDLLMPSGSYSQASGVVIPSSIPSDSS